jgi:predicted RNA methylase
VNLLAPCCGEGLALSQLAEGAKATTYGVELDEHRAELARANLDHVLKCGYEDTRISNNAFSCLFLNPPSHYRTRAKRRDKP